MQTLSLIPECVISVSTREEGSVETYQDLASLPIERSQRQLLYLPIHDHTTGIWNISEDNSAQVEQRADIVLTNSSHAIVAHQFADCVPLLFVDRKQRAFCFAHAGWKGLTIGAVQVSLLALQKQYHSQLDDLWVWIGPCIQKESYVFSQEPVQSRLPTWANRVSAQEGAWSIDLPGFISDECVRFGIDPTRIISDGRDTYALSGIFFSHQRFLRTQDPKERGVFVVTCNLL